MATLRSTAQQKLRNAKARAAKFRGRASSKPIPSEAGEYAASLDELKQFFRDMLLVRRFEERAGQMYGMGLIGGFCHLYIGQEAVVVGVQSALKPGDSVITSYRDHGHILSCGVEPGPVMAELAGRAAGVSKGKGGSMHMFDPDKGFYGGHGIVGASVPLGAGLAFAHQYRGDGGVCITYFGDGAANQGQVYEAFNMAELWQLPAVFIVENNQYAMGTSIQRSSAETQLSRRGESFRIPGAQVDGMNVLAVRAAADEAVHLCRAGQGPILLEMMTYRYRGHSMSDPAKYRTREEVTKVREERDPIEHLREQILASKTVSEDELKAMDTEIKEIVAQAAEFAQASPEPDVAELYTDITA